MDTAILFKILQRRYKYRNPNNLSGLPGDLIYSRQEYTEARDYILHLQKLGIQYCFPTHPLYPTEFKRMKEAPLFFEYLGAPVWQSCDFLAVVGSREISPLTESWMKTHLTEFVVEQKTGIVSGGARGVDQLAHQIALRAEVPTIVVLPSGLLNLYPKNLETYRELLNEGKLCFFSEFEVNQKLHKSHFFFRNRSIAGFGKATLVTQATRRSGSLLTVHHSLEIGKQVITVPAHPELFGFCGNVDLQKDGAKFVFNFQELRDLWLGEVWV